jgi:glycosyltransferase involved in cell wall biosynthesis
MAQVSATITAFPPGVRFEQLHRVLDRHEQNLIPWGPDGISVVIPAWNEEARLPATLEQYLPFLEAFNIPVEVIVVVDGVTDRTAEIAASYASRGVHVLKFDHKLGKGGAIIEGFRRARFDFVGFLDADAPVTPVSVAYAISQLTSADAAIASRWHARSSQDRRQPISRLFFSKVWSLLARAVLSMPVRDTQCGAKFFRREAVMQILPQVILTNWAFDASLLFHLHRAGFKIVEVPVNWKDDPGTKLRLGRVVPAMFLSLFGIRLMSLPFLPSTTRAWAGWFYKQFG